MCPLHPGLLCCLPPHLIPPGWHRAPALGALYHTSNLHWLSVLRMVVYMFQCYSLKSSHRRLLPLSPKVYSYFKTYRLPEKQECKHLTQCQSALCVRLLNIDITILVIFSVLAHWILRTVRDMKKLKLEKEDNLAIISLKWLICSDIMFSAFF